MSSEKLVQKKQESENKENESNPLIKIKENQFIDNYDTMGKKFNSLCFGEGAIQSFEFNYENFKYTKPLQVQVSIKHIIHELIKQMNGEVVLENQCDNIINNSIEDLRHSFLSLEVQYSSIESSFEVNDVKPKEKEKLQKMLNENYIDFQENLRELKANIFENMIEPNFRLERTGLGLQFEFDALVRRKKFATEDLFGELKLKFRERGDMRLFSRLVRKSEDIIEDYVVKSEDLKGDFFGRFEETNQGVLRRYNEDLNEIGRNLNKNFWSIMSTDYRKRNEQEKTCDYVDFVIETLQNNFEILEESLKKNELGQKQWNVNSELESLIEDMSKTNSKIKNKVISLWNKASDKIKFLWHENYPENPPIIDELPPKIDPETLEPQIIESTEIYSSLITEVDHNLTKNGVCNDPVRQYLDLFYQEMIDLEIKFSSVEGFVFGSNGPSESKIKSKLESEYGRIVEVLRAYKGKVDETVWVKLHGSMNGWGVVRKQWKWILQEMREEWQERVETKRRTLLMKGARLQDIQDAIREHDRWLEQLEEEDETLFKNEVEAFWTVREVISRRIRRFYLGEAKELNLLLWEILEGGTWSSEKKLEKIAKKLLKLLSERDISINFRSAIKNLHSQDERLEKNQKEINSRHIELWNKALLESDLYWEEIIRNIREENQEGSESDSYQKNRLACYGNQVFDRAQEPVDIDSTFQRFLFMEVQFETLSSFVWRYLEKTQESFSFLNQFYQEWVELTREWKSSQYEKLLKMYLPAHRKLTDVLEKYYNSHEEFVRIRKDNQREIKRRWILKNDSPRSLEKLSLLLEEVDSSWRTSEISNDERLSMFKNKLLGFLMKIHKNLMIIAGKINKALFRIIREEMAKIDSTLSMQEKMRIISTTVIRRIKVFVMEIQTGWWVKLEEIKTRLRFNVKEKLESIRESMKNDVQEENDILMKALYKLKEKTGNEVPEEHECSQDILEEMEQPLTNAYEKMIYNEISLSTVRRILWKIISLTSRDKFKVWTEISKYHEKWMEKTRRYKSEVYHQVLGILFEDNSELVEIFKKWDQTVNLSIESWRKKSESMVSHYIEEENGTAIIHKIKVKTEIFINDALEMDLQLKKFYFENYLEKLPNIESEVANDFSKLATMINLHYFSSLTKIISLYTVENSTNSIQDPIFKILKTVWQGISLWFSDEIPNIDGESWKKTLIGSVQIILKTKIKILKEHTELWDVLNKKFDLAGPDGSMTEIIDEGGKCDVFKLIRGPTVA